MPMETASVLYKGKPGRGTRMLSPGLQRTPMESSMAWLQPLVRMTSCKRDKLMGNRDKLMGNRDNLMGIGDKLVGN